MKWLGDNFGLGFQHGQVFFYVQEMGGWRHSIRIEEMLRRVDELDCQRARERILFCLHLQYELPESFPFEEPEMAFAA